MNYLTSSFSLQMLPEGGTAEITRLPRLSIRGWMDEARVGHEGTAAVLTELLGVDIRIDRRPVVLQVGDELKVAQLVVQQLVPGSNISDPELAFFHVRVSGGHQCDTSSFTTKQLENELAWRRKVCGWRPGMDDCNNILL